MTSLKNFGLLAEWGLNEVGRVVPDTRLVNLLSVIGPAESPIIGHGPNYNSSLPEPVTAICFKANERSPYFFFRQLKFLLSL
jgi:hypothetical protein